MTGNLTTIVILGRHPMSFLSEAKNLPRVSRQSHLPLRPRPFDFAQGDISLLRLR